MKRLPARISYFSIDVSSSNPSILPGYFVARRGGRLLNKRGPRLPSLNPPRYHYPREILAAEYISPSFFRNSIRNIRTVYILRSLHTRDRYAPREDIKALPCLVSKGARRNTRLSRELDIYARQVEFSNYVKLCKICIIKYRGVNRSFGKFVKADSACELINIRFEFAFTRQTKNFEVCLRNSRVFRK